MTSSLTGSNWFYTLDTTEPLLWPNQYTITVRAFDKAGNLGEEEITIVIIDDTAPTLKVLSPAQGTSFKQDDVLEISGSAVDNFNVEEIQLKFNDGRKWRDYTRDYNSETGSFLIELSGTELPEGTNKISIKAVDVYGNEAEGTLTVIIESSSDKDKSKSTLEESLDFFISDLRGIAICGIVLLVFIAALFAFLKPRFEQGTAEEGRKMKKDRS
jgi:hypothetical protein